MAEDRRQAPSGFNSSLNERERRQIINKVNVDNKVMLSRLQGVGPRISKKEFEDDFLKHLQSKETLRRKLRMAGPQSSPSKSRGDSVGVGGGGGGSGVGDDSTVNPSFNAEAYLARFGTSVSSSAGGSGGGGGGPAPISSISEFRKQVIASKKNLNHANTILPALDAHASHSHSHTHGGGGGGDGQSTYPCKPQIRFELKHNPSS